MYALMQEIYVNMFFLQTSKFKKDCRHRVGISPEERQAITQFFISPK